jgi:hypothetical protein
MPEFNKRFRVPRSIKKFKAIDGPKNATHHYRDKLKKAD